MSRVEHSSKLGPKDENFSFFAFWQYQSDVILDPTFFNFYHNGPEMGDGAGRRSLGVRSADRAFLPVDFLFLPQVQTHLPKPKWASSSSSLLDLVPLASSFLRLLLLLLVFLFFDSTW